MSGRRGAFVALKCNETILSYKGLNDKADRFANYLHGLGVKSGDTVALCLERSFDWVVSALGIMRAGAAYVPLDPSCPDSRLSYVLKDSDAKILVSRSTVLDRLEIEQRGVDPRRDAVAIAANQGSINHIPSLEDLAYIIYTSGSTGRPKGVEITHGNLAHLARWHRRAFDVSPEDRASHLAGLAFDAAAWEMWPNLCAGATLVLIDDASRSSPELIRDWINREKVTVAFVPTVHAQPMMAMEWPSMTPLRYLLTGGDVLQHAPPKGLPFAVVNNYGPTECCVVSTSVHLPSGSDQIPSIGRPIDGTKVYLLDEFGKQVDDGSPGEIYITGGGVGRGYRNLERESRTSFLPDPFSQSPGSRMFRSGDRGVRLPNGELHFLGRFDRQVKVRGQRVELDEVGVVLSRHPAVEFATAMAAATENSETQLIGYVLLKKNASPPTAKDLRQFMVENLPHYMVPSAFVALVDLPLSPNGKIDFTLLPSLKDIQITGGAVENRGSRSPTEEKLLDLVRRLLRDDTVTAADNFFLAGGHSLLGMQLILILQDNFGVNLTLQELFEAPSVEELAVYVESALTQARLEAIWKGVLGLQQIGYEDDFFSCGGSPKSAATLCQRITVEFSCEMSVPEIHSNPTIRRQAGLLVGHTKDRRPLPPGVLALRPFGSHCKIFWIHYLSANLARVIGDDQPFFSVALSADDVAHLGNSPSVSCIASRLLEKIKAVQANGPYILGGLCLGGVLAYELASQFRAAGEDVSLLVLVDPPSPSYSLTRNSLAGKWSYFRYLMKRAEWLGPRTSALYFLERLLKQLPRAWRQHFGFLDVHVAQELTEDAVFSYRPHEYDGKTLLILASRRPEVGPLSEWQAMVPSALQTMYIDAYHRELMDPPNARRIAEAILGLLPSSDAKRLDSPSATDTGRETRCAQGKASLALALPGK